MLCVKCVRESSPRGQLDLVPVQEITVRKWRYSGLGPEVLPSVSRLTAQEARLFNSEGYMNTVNLLQGHVAKGFLWLGGAALTYEQETAGLPAFIS